MILVTGHRGFVGGYLFPTLPGSVGADLVEEIDIADRAAMEALFAKHPIKTVINLAARAGVRGGARNPEEYIRTNINGTHLLLTLAEQYGVEHFIQFSSSSVYGNQRPPNPENLPFAPHSLYGVTKAAGEMLCAASPVPTTVVRPFTLYGKGGRADQVVYSWLNCYRDSIPAPFYGDGTSKRGYTHVLDVVSGVTRILERGPQQPHETYNLGGSEVISLRELRSIFEEELPDIRFSELPMPTSDVLENWADTGRAEQELGWRPQHTFQSEMRAIIKNFLKEEMGRG
jgi:UDP-glucuronate 4-epimerase